MTSTSKIYFALLVLTVVNLTKQVSKLVTIITALNVLLCVLILIVYVPTRIPTRTYLSNTYLFVIELV